LVEDKIVDDVYSIDCATNAVTSGYNGVPIAGTVATDLVTPLDDFFTATNYRGAFAPGTVAFNAAGVGSFFGDNAAAIANCPEDVNGDGDVNISDFLQLIGSFDTSCAQ